MWHKNSGAFVFEVSFAIALWPEQVPVAMQEIHLYKHAAPSIVRAFQGSFTLQSLQRNFINIQDLSWRMFPTRKYLPYLPATRSPLGDGPRLGAGSKEIFKPSSPSSYRRGKNVKSQDVTRLPYVPWILVE